MANKKFTELPVTSLLSDNDIFAIVDDLNAQQNSKQITAENISRYMYSFDASGTGTSVLSGDNLTNLKAAINGAANVSNGVRAATLFLNGSYQTPEQLLDYSNIGGNKPIAITQNSQIANSEGYIKKINFGSANGLELGIGNPQDQSGAPNQGVITTDDIREGSTNLYFSAESVELALQDQFRDLFNTYSDIFDDGNTSPSLTNVSATWRQENLAGTYPNQNCTVLQVPSSAQGGPDSTSFSPGQVIRIYGGSSSSLLNSPSKITSASLISDLGGFNTGETDDIGVTLTYVLAKFNLTTGEVGPRSEPYTATISVNGNADANDIYESFSRDNYISFNLAGVVSDTEGVLVYRKTSTQADESVYKLASVVSGIDLPLWKDYYTFDYAAWSDKIEADNTYPVDKTIHFPAELPVTPSDVGEVTGQNETFRGWIDAEITSVEVNEADPTQFFTIVLNPNNPIFVNNVGGQFGHTVSIAHNDTSKINTGISTKISNKIKSLSINAKTYNVTKINLPSEFGLIGVLGMTKVTKLPWSGYPDGINATNSVIDIPGDNAKNVTLDSVDFDGNSLNQYHLGESRNRFIDFGNTSTDITVNNCKVKNIIGDGIFASIPLRFKMSLSEISNSGLTDRHDFFPLIVDSGENTMLTGNVIQNFTTNVDATVSKESVFANNVIKNVGTGLDIYGSRFIVSSPNVLMGPANEFLSTPDILNSEFDLINLLRQTIVKSSPFTSDPLVYQEGPTPSVFDLTQNSISNLTDNIEDTPGELIYRVDAVNVDTDGDHNVYGRGIGPGITDANNTAFTYQNLRTDRLYEISQVGDVDWTEWGACVNKIGAKFVYNGTSQSFGSATSGAIHAREFTGYTTDGGTRKSPLAFTDLSGTDKTNGEFQFRIEDGTDHTTYTDLTDDSTGAYTSTALKNMYASHVKQSLSDVTAGRIHNFGTKHFALQWSASYRYYSIAGEKQGDSFIGGIATDNGSFKHGQLDANGKTPAQYSDASNIPNVGNNVNGQAINDPMNANRYFVDFTVLIDKIDHVQEGDHVRFKRGTAFNPYVTGSNVTLNPYNGFMWKMTPVLGQTTTLCVIRYYGADSGSPIDSSVLVTGTTAENGYIHIMDDFVLASGLIK
jgi:hypothetical protein